MINALQSNRMRITIAMVTLFGIYAIIGIIVCMQESNLNLFPKFAVPLALWAVATIILSESIRKLNHGKHLVRILAIIALVTVPICAVLYMLLTWEIIPAYEQTTVSLYSSYSYSTSVPSLMAKITYAIAYISTLGFLGSVVLAFKDNGEKLVFPISFAATVSLACATVTGIVSLFSNTSSYINIITGGNTQATIFSIFSWISFVSLAAVAFYLSKFGKNIAEDKKLTPSPNMPQMPATPTVVPPIQQPHPQSQPVAIPSPTITELNNPSSKQPTSPEQSLGAQDLTPLHPISFNTSTTSPTNQNYNNVR